MLSIGFWNTHRRPLLEPIANWVSEHELNVVLLAESPIDSKSMSVELSNRLGNLWNSPRLPLPRFCISYRDPVRSCEPRSVDTHDRAPVLALATNQEIINIALVHFPSLLHRSENSYELITADLARRIDEEEQRANHLRTMLIGDLNLNPFSNSVVSAAGLHATMSLQVLGRGTRVVDGIKKKMFYNPMWRFLGDSAESPPGTYYHASSGSIAYFWHTFDQVLLRAPLAQRLLELKIVTSLPSYDLATSSGRPNKEKFSDHFPIIVKLSNPVKEGFLGDFPDS